MADQDAQRNAEEQPLLASSSEVSDDTTNSQSRTITNAVICALAVLLGTIAIVIVVNSSQHRGKLDDLPDFTKLPKPKSGLRNPSYFVSGLHGAVATEESRCSAIGVDILKENGTATDAAIASALCIGVLNSFSSGIGGGGFMVIRPKTCTNVTVFKGHETRGKGPCQAPVAIDFRETATTGAHHRMFAKSPQLSRIGGLSIGVPGEIRGFEAAYALHGGGVSWARLFEPAAKLAEEFKTGKELARRIPLFGQGWMEDKPEWAKVFFPSGTAAKVGEVLRRPEYAEALRRIGSLGAGEFYSGKIADSVLATINKAGGLMTKEDLANYKAIVSPALVSTYRNRTYYTTEAPSGGPILINLLNTLEGYDLVTEGRTGLTQHRFVEALKFAFARRTEIGDPKFLGKAAFRQLQKIQLKSFAEETRRNITDDRTHHIGYYDPKFDINEDHGTTHLSIVDQWGSAVSLTTTVNLIFGSRIMDPSTGIILNDEMDDFNTPNTPNAFGLRPSPYNYPSPGKRPMSSTSAVVFDTEEGEVWTALGGSGGSRIFGAVAQVILGLDWGMDLSHSIEEPRVHDQLLPAMVTVESGYREDLLNELRARGHNVTLFDINVAVAEVQGVLRDDRTGRLFAASDSRKNGIAAAY